MHDGARAGAALWLGIFAVAGILLAALVHLGPALATLVPRGGPQADCGEPPRYAEWRAAFRSTVQEGRDERIRREAVDYLTKCRSLHGASKATVRKRLGKPLASNWTKQERGKYLEYYLGPDGLAIDEETLYLHFDRRGRLFDLSVEQG